VVQVKPTGVSSGESERGSHHVRVDLDRVRVVQLWPAHGAPPSGSGVLRCVFLGVLDGVFVYVRDLGHEHPVGSLSLSSVVVGLTLVLADVPPHEATEFCAH
jgi:hypothetical protein